MSEQAIKANGPGFVALTLTCNALSFVIIYHSKASAFLKSVSFCPYRLKVSLISSFNFLLTQSPHPHVWKALKLGGPSLMPPASWDSQVSHSPEPCPGCAVTEWGWMDLHISSSSFYYFFWWDFWCQCPEQIRPHLSFQRHRPWRVPRCSEACQAGRFILLSMSGVFLGPEHLSRVTTILHSYEISAPPHLTLLNLNGQRLHSEGPSDLLALLWRSILDPLK